MFECRCEEVFRASYIYQKRTPTFNLCNVECRCSKPMETLSMTRDASSINQKTRRTFAVYINKEHNP